jgi:hypothetical protein
MKTNNDFVNHKYISLRDDSIDLSKLYILRINLPFDSFYINNTDTLFLNTMVECWTVDHSNMNDVHYLYFKNESDLLLFKLKYPELQYVK